MGVPREHTVLVLVKVNLLRSTRVTRMIVERFPGRDLSHSTIRTCVVEHVESAGNGAADRSHSRVSAHRTRNERWASVSSERTCNCLSIYSRINEQHMTQSHVIVAPMLTSDRQRNNNVTHLHEETVAQVKTSSNEQRERTNNCIVIVFRTRAVSEY
jgi:hypothetical protein